MFDWFRPDLPGKKGERVGGEFAGCRGRPYPTVSLLLNLTYKMIGPRREDYIDVIDASLLLTFAKAGKMKEALRHCFPSSTAAIAVQRLSS